MLVSKLLMPTLRQLPSDAQVISHQLMLKAGLIRKLASGIYTYLPLGLRVIKKISAIIESEMNKAGAQEVLMPMVQPCELWKESGRFNNYGAELLRFKDRKDTWFCLGPTHEEVITALSPHVLVMAHLSHVYTDGGGLYFTFAAPLKGKEHSIDFYDMVWEKAMLATQKVGGIISHHHGVGRLKAKFMEKEWGRGAELFHALKKYYDPDGVMNPGKLLPC